MGTVAFQPEFRPALPRVFGAKDYRDFRDTLIEMDRILVESGLEDAFVCRHLDASCPEAENTRRRAFRVKVARKALRHTILLAITGLSVRELATRLPDSALFAWFTGSVQLDGVRPVSKSTLDRFEKMFSEDDVARLVHDLNRLAMDANAAPALLFEKPLDVEEVFADTTCVEANIHFPVDWVLLRDAVRTLTKAISLIRAQGLVNRMSSPSRFMRQMNQLCIEMTHAGRTKDARRTRKAVLRKMKKLTKVISLHAQRHRDLLVAGREKTAWSEAEARQVLGRISNVLDQLPAAIHQAHERLIGERQVKNADKILSLYDPDVHVIVRGKAGAAVEFGNGLYLAEQAQGLIVDWAFIRNQPPSDGALVEESLARIEKNYARPGAFVADRGFHSKANGARLESAEIFNAICPKSVRDLQDRLGGDPRFRQLQTRRGSTEGRVAILTNDYVGTPLRSKGFKNRSVRIVWCILAHNLWKLAATAAARQRERRKTQAA